MSTLPQPVVLKKVIDSPDVLVWEGTTRYAVLLDGKNIGHIRSMNTTSGRRGSGAKCKVWMGEIDTPEFGRHEWKHFVKRSAVIRRINEFVSK